MKYVFESKNDVLTVSKDDEIIVKTKDTQRARMSIVGDLFLKHKSFHNEEKK